MAIENTLVSSALTINYKDGVDEAGKDVIKSKKFSNIKVDAVTENLYSAANALSSLMKYPALEFVRSDNNLITNSQA